MHVKITLSFEVEYFPKIQVLRLLIFLPEQKGPVTPSKNCKNHSCFDIKDRYYSLKNKNRLYKYYNDKENIRHMYAMARLMFVVFCCSFLLCPRMDVPKLC